MFTTCNTEVVYCDMNVATERACYSRQSVGSECLGVGMCAYVVVIIIAYYYSVCVSILYPLISETPQQLDNSNGLTCKLPQITSLLDLNQSAA